MLEVPFRYNPVREPHPIERQQIHNGGYLLGPIDLSAASFAGAGYLVGTLLVPIGQSWMVESVSMSCNKAWLANASIGATTITGSGTFPTATVGIHGAAYTPIVVPLKTLLRGGVVTSQNTWVRVVYDTDLTNCRFAFYVTGYAFTDDLNFAAPKTILCIGDSIWNGTGPTSKDTFIPWMIRKYYTDAGNNCRIVNPSVSGSTSVAHETLRARGQYDLPQVSAIFYSVGANDATQGTSAVTFKANIANLIAWKQDRYPLAKLVVLGATPLENNTSETALALLRTAASQAVSEAADSRVLYLSLGASFDRTNSANYASTDTPGSRVHPSDTGINTEWTTTLRPFLVASVSTI